MSPSRKSRELLHLCRFGGAPAKLAGGPFLPTPCWALGHEGRACCGLLPRAPLLPGARWGRAVTVARDGGTGGEPVPPAACQGGDGRAVTHTLSYFTVVLEQVVERQAPF